MNPERLEKFRQVVARRQPNLTVILENVTDMHNIGAVLRSCDSVGICEIFVLNTEPQLAKPYVVIGKKTSSGTRKWVDVHYYTDPEACLNHVRKKYGRILATHLDESAADLYELDLSQPTAFLFGNEHSGLSEQVRKLSDGNFRIPQAGMAESLNISVACAITLFEAYRQRKIKGFYDENPPLGADEQNALLEEYISRHEHRFTGRKIVKRKG
jgi:tRNA (guanosine-2'-O-)-methyltransferase